MSCESNGGGCSCSGDAVSDDTAAVRARLSKIKHKVIVLSGKGGVGKSTVATNLAVALSSEGKRVGLMDVDFHGPSIPGMLNLKKEKLTSNGSAVVPFEVAGLKVVSIGLLIDDADAAVIWRGPMKMTAITQFVKDVEWGELDYLIIDSPPGTGDEPLSVCQVIEDLSGAVVVTTPQSVAVDDVRRSVNFCHQLNIPVLGVVENMSGFVCPKCGELTEIFKSGGGEKMASEMKVPFLGKIPIDPQIAHAGDDGKPYVYHFAKTESAKCFEKVVSPILAMDVMNGKAAAEQVKEKGGNVMRIAIPMVEGKLSNHFGHCEKFALLDVNKDTGAVESREDITPPPHEPGLLPKWLAEKNADLIIAGGMGNRAQGLFTEQGIIVVTGAPVDEPENIVKAYCAGTLVTGDNLCDH
ncbi:MAG: P-loop NTPase [Planctomycetes bacterium]|nr:P-loop NTPase [Planctomycetota bacterium]